MGDHSCRQIGKSFHTLAAILHTMDVILSILSVSLPVCNLLRYEGCWLASVFLFGR
jgi:hypothetical protein